MTFFKLDKNNFEHFTLQTYPARTFVSGVNVGYTGAINVFTELSNTEYEVRNTALTATYNEANFVGPAASDRLQRKNSSKFIVRNIPDTDYTKNTIKKNTMIKTLMPYYRQFSPSMNFSFTNYHSLNFFTASYLPSNTALIYPALTGTFLNVISGTYAVSNEFTFEFNVNPRYTFETDGTILHHSSNYAISLVTGSKTFANGDPSHFRIKLQLSHSAGLLPNRSVPEANGGTHKNNLTFLSNDNVLVKNHWHNVQIVWHKDMNSGTGSFIVDGNGAGFFVVTSSVKPSNPRIPGALVVGNFYNGNDTGANKLINFFNTTARTSYGTEDQAGAVSDPTAANTPLNNPLNAEIHEIRIFKRRRTDDQLREYSNKSLPLFDVESTGAAGLVFYLPPFFTEETHIRNVRVSPFDFMYTTTERPFNTIMSFATNGYEVNLENYTRDFAQKQWPRLYNLVTASTGPNEAEGVTNILLESGIHLKRNLTILPNDNGLFTPNFELLRSKMFYTGSRQTRYSSFVSGPKNPQFGDITLLDMVSTATLEILPTVITGVSFDQLVGIKPHKLKGHPGDVFAIPQSTGDVSSNEICWFEISNLFYDKQIAPRSLTITDKHMTGSEKQFRITLKDDGYGNIYRADSITKHATWSSIGNIFYSEGIVLIKAPTLRNFGKDEFIMEFSGTHNVHVHRTYIKAPHGLVNSSSHPAYTSRVIDNRIMKNKTDNVTITGINLYNKDFNIVGKISLAQALEKFSSDEFLFRISMDW